MAEKGHLVGRNTLDRFARATREIESRPRDNRRVQSGHRRSTNASDYNGYFKIIQTDSNKLKVIDGFDDTAANCATVRVNTFNCNVLVSEQTITANCVIYVEYALTGGDPATGATGEIKQAAAFPDYEDGKEVILISRVTFGDGAITGYTSELVPIRVYVPGNCSSGGA